MPVPTITTSRLTLRPFRAADLQPLFAILQEPGIFQYFPRTTAPPLEKVERIINEQLEQYEHHDLGEWAVEWKDAPGLLGWCGLNYLRDSDEFEVAYLLTGEVRGQGVATEGARASLEYGFGPRDLCRIIALVREGDTVVFEDEVNPAIDAALASGLEITGLHNHFFFDQPRVYFMHIGGEGNVFDSLRAGVDVVTYSGDKMLGGPQGHMQRAQGELAQRGDRRFQPGDPAIRGHCLHVLHARQ